MLQHRRDVIALEAQARLAQIAGGHEPSRRAIELQRRQQMLDLEEPVELDGAFRDLLDHLIDDRSQLGEVARPRQRDRSASAACENACRALVAGARFLEQPRGDRRNVCGAVAHRRQSIRDWTAGGKIRAEAAAADLAVDAGAAAAISRSASGTGSPSSERLAVPDHSSEPALRRRRQLADVLKEQAPPRAAATRLQRRRLELADRRAVGRRGPNRMVSRRTASIAQSMTINGESGEAPSWWSSRAIEMTSEPGSATSSTPPSILAARRRSSWMRRSRPIGPAARLRRFRAVA